jgi:hypothetical protein
MHYKFLNKDGSPCNGGTGNWSLPPNAEWMPPVKGLSPCASGYHVCEKEDLLAWAGPALFEVDVGWKRVRDSNKTVVQDARLIREVEGWNNKNLRLFAADCTEHVLPLYIKSNPYDNGQSIVDCIAITRKFAYGKATKGQLVTAWDAAWSHGWSSSWTSSQAASWAKAWISSWSSSGAESWDAACHAARNAAEVASFPVDWDESWAAGGDAAWAAERKWQTETLCSRVL